MTMVDLLEHKGATQNVQVVYQVGIVQGEITQLLQIVLF